MRNGRSRQDLSLRVTSDEQRCSSGDRLLANRLKRRSAFRAYSSIDAGPLDPQYPLMFEAAMNQPQFLALLTALALLTGACGGSSGPVVRAPTVSLPSGEATVGSPTSSVPPGLLQARVVHVIDGDTIVVDQTSMQAIIRLIGVDTPETVAPGRSVDCFGPEASATRSSFWRARRSTSKRTSARPIASRAYCATSTWRMAAW